jgi:hypothetical protein
MTRDTADATEREDPADDPLLRALRELPAHAASDRVPGNARAAFARAFDGAPWYAKLFGTAGRALVPTVLASVVGLYLFWAFATAIALNHQ